MAFSFFKKYDKNQEKLFKFKIGNGSVFPKGFQPNKELQYVREELAKDKKIYPDKDYPEANNLQFFDKAGTSITYECEKYYNLETICDKESIIHVEFLLRSINVNVDGLEEHTVYLNPKSKLTEIREKIKEKTEDKIKGEFLFRKQNGGIIKTTEENSNNLKKFLKNDTLYISILQETEMIIIIYSDKTHHHSFKRSLDKRMSLFQIRSILANNKFTDPERMKSNHRFSDQENTFISEVDEDKKKLYEVLRINGHGLNVLNILKRDDDPDWAKLVNKCGYGFVIDKDSMFVKQIQSPRHRAFTIKTTTQPYEVTDYKDSEFECESEFQELRKKNFITFGKVGFVLPFISISFGLNQILSREKPNSYETNTKYSYIQVKRAKIDIDKNDIDITDEFKNDIREALEKGTRNKKVAKLKEIADKYGHFYARSMSFGGVAIQKIESFKHSGCQALSGKASLGTKSNTENCFNSSKSKSSSTCEIKGGNKDEYQHNRINWINSLNDSNTWDIIEHNNVYSIFDLLKGDLRKNVIKVLGKRILKDGIDEIMYSTSGNDPYCHDIGWELDDISNIEDCEIFSTVMKEHNRHIFSSCVTYDAPDAPVIVIQRVPSEKKPRKKFRKLKVGTIYVRNDLNNMFQKEVEWNPMNQKDKIFSSSKLDAIDSDENKLIFVNQLFENPNNNHRIINVAFESLGCNSLLCGSLDKESFTKMI
ncbi:2196_t:CDS:2 [Racocetra fulgida]|uniref:2196_t:CDS:1 n=1 Tax=Racocetra fulgida TaxID=60492 RepID=A0A9N9G396_9GLOM|nr:2196_t:CDS:2 [Racocetra fulgida]